MKQLKTYLPSGVLELDDGTLGAYVKLKALGSMMPIRGVYVNGKVLMYAYGVPSGRLVRYRRFGNSGSSPA